MALGTLVAADSETVDRAFSQMKAAIRANYSNPPAHGASVVATILATMRYVRFGNKS
ncbi:hypothetical protein ACLK17_05870 [Escherichia coli]